MEGTPFNGEILAQMGKAARYDASSLARICNLSQRQMQRRFRAAFGCSPQAWLDEHRINAARPLLLSGISIKTVAFDLGFKQCSHFCRKFKIHTRMTPSEFVVTSRKNPSTPPHVVNG